MEVRQIRRIVLLMTRPKGSEIHFVVVQVVERACWIMSQRV